MHVSLSCDIKRINSILKFEVYCDVTLWPWASSIDISEDRSGFFFRIEESEKNDIASRTIVHPWSEVVDSSRLLGFYIAYKSRTRLCIRYLDCRNINFSRFASRWWQAKWLQIRGKWSDVFECSDFLWSRVRNSFEPHNPWMHKSSQG